MRLLPVVALMIFFCACTSNKKNNTKQDESKISDSCSIVQAEILSHEWQIYDYASSPIVGLTDSAVKSYLRTRLALSEKYFALPGDTCLAPTYKTTRVLSSEFEKKELRKVTLKDLGITSRYIYVTHVNCNSEEETEIWFQGKTILFALDGVYFHCKQN